MIYSEYYVNRLLAPFIKKLWSLDNSDGTVSVPQKSVLPNGCFTMVFIMGNEIAAETCKQRVLLKPGIYFCGQLTSAIKVDIRPYTKAIMVQLHAWTPAYFTGTDMELLTDKIIPVSEKDIKPDREICNEPRIADAVYSHFKGHFHPGANAALLAESCLQLIDAGGNMTVGELSIKLKCSSRHLQKIFRRHIGMSPKEFALILKIRNAADDLADHQATRFSLTRLALKNNFYDQSHFIHTFKHITHASPRKFKAEDHLLAFKQ